MGSLLLLNIMEDLQKNIEQLMIDINNRIREVESLDAVLAY